MNDNVKMPWERNTAAGQIWVLAKTIVVLSLMGYEALVTASWSFNFNSSEEWEKNNALKLLLFQKIVTRILLVNEQS